MTFQISFLLNFFDALPYGCSNLDIFKQLRYLQDFSCTRPKKLQNFYPKITTLFILKFLHSENSPLLKYAVFIQKPTITDHMNIFWAWRSTPIHLHCLEKFYKYLSRVSTFDQLIMVAG